MYLETKAFKAVKEWLLINSGIDNLDNYSEEVVVLMQKYLKAHGLEAEPVGFRLPGRGFHYCIETENGIFDPTISSWDKLPHGVEAGTLYAVTDSSPHEKWKSIEITERFGSDLRDIKFPVPETEFST